MFFSPNLEEEEGKRCFAEGVQFLLEDGDTGDAGGYGVHAIFER